MTKTWHFYTYNLWTATKFTVLVWTAVFWQSKTAVYWNEIISYSSISLRLILNSQWNILSTITSFWLWANCQTTATHCSVVELSLWLFAASFDWLPEFVPTLLVLRRGGGSPPGIMPSLRHVHQCILSVSRRCCLCIQNWICELQSCCIDIVNIITIHGVYGLLSTSVRRG